MKKCSDVRQNFDAVLFEELAADQLELFRQHLHSCAKCKKQFEAFRRVTDVMKEYRREKASPEFMHSLWSGIEQQLSLKTARKNTFIETIKELINLDVRWVRYAAAVSLIAAGIIIGRFMFVESRQDTVVAEQERTENKILEAKAQRYLERSKVLLLGILNHESDAGSDFSRQRQLSGDLIREAAILKDELKDSKKLLLSALIEDLDKILLQIAHLEEKYDLEAVEMIQAGIRSEGILFKINLEEINQSTQPDHKTKVKSSRSS